MLPPSSATIATRGPGAGPSSSETFWSPLCCLGGVAGHVTLIDYYHTLQIQVYTWRPLESYYRQGFLPSFISGAQTIKPPKPEDYSVEAAENLLSEYADAYDDSEQATSTRRARKPPPSLTPRGSPRSSPS